MERQAVQADRTGVVRAAGWRSGMDWWEGGGVIVSFLLIEEGLIGS